MRCTSVWLKVPPRRAAGVVPARRLCRAAGAGALNAHGRRTVARGSAERKRKVQRFRSVSKRSRRGGPNIPGRKVLSFGGRVVGCEVVGARWGRIGASFTRT